VFEIETVAVLGTSEGGTACAVLAALAGCSVRLHDPSDPALDLAREALRRRIEAAYEHGAITRAEQQRVLDAILLTVDLDEALTGADLAVDARSAAAPDTVGAVGASLRSTAVVAAAGVATAAELAAGLPHPGRVLALRLAEPGGSVPRLEIAAGPSTTAHALERARAFAARVTGAASVPAASPHASRPVAWRGGSESP
jgi:3-hydroxybutyryl-CoA dehydrogenase